ncbi:YlqD family protein [Bacillus salitolerans]|uniref:YlqD family protein n=1 Tax=Bacillus salitolerans TaxID=1437434 RepID=A0ABW4LMQ8_9BACI
MKILQKVVVKQVLTEKSKLELSEKLNEKKLQLQKEHEQLRFERKKLESTTSYPSPAARIYEKEMKQRLEKIKNIDFQIQQLHMLPLGSELKEKEVQAMVDVNVGDNWVDLDKTIIIKEGKVIEIR